MVRGSSNGAGLSADSGLTCARPYSAGPSRYSTLSCCALLCEQVAVVVEQLHLDRGLVDSTGWQAVRLVTHDSAFAFRPGEICRPVGGLGLAPPFVRTNPRDAASLGFPVFGAAFQSMTQARLESIDCFGRGDAFDLRAD